MKNKKSNKNKVVVIRNKDGSFNRVKIIDDILSGRTKSIERTIYNYLKQHIDDYSTIIESGQKVYLGKDLPRRICVF